MYISKWLENSYSRKILTCNDIKTGLRLVRQANREGIARFNVSVKSLKQLATELIMNDLALNGGELDFVDNSVCSIIVNELLCENADSFKALIPSECMCLATADEVLSVINQIRMNKHREAFENGKDEKVKLIKKIIALYEKRLADEGKDDYCTLLKRATELTDGNDYFSDCDFGVLDYLDFTSVEAEFINRLTGASHYDEISYCEKPEGNNSNKLSFFKAYGISNELEYIVRDIEKRKLPLGEVNIFYSDDVYVGYIRAALESRNITYGIISPYSATSLELVGFMLGIIGWARSGYHLSELEGVVVNNKFDVKKSLSQFDTAVDSGIGWGLERYEAYIEVNAPTENDEMSVNNFLKDLVNAFKSYSGAVSDLYADLLEITLKFTKNSNEEKKLVGKKLSGLKRAFGEVSKVMPLNDALELIKQKLEALRVNDDEKTNGVSVIKQGKTFVIERKYNYFIGLANDFFLSREIESPLLSDNELSSYLMGSINLAMDKNRKKETSIINTMYTARNAEFIFGYSVYDAAELRENAPSYFYRRLAGDEFDKIAVFSYPDIVDYGININGDKVFEGLNEGSELKFRLPHLSATRVKAMLECPMKFYYSYIAGVPKLNYNDDGRVDSFTGSHKGNLYHGVLDRYASSELMKEPNEIAPDINQKAFDEIFEEIFEEIKREVPCISPTRMEKEKSDLKNSLAEHICLMHKEFSDTKREKNWQIEMCEKQFGDFVYTLSYGDKSVDLTFSGRIDRVDSYTDASGNKHYRVVDYKTGKFGKDECEGAKITNIQHILYAMYMASMGYAVEESGYITLDEKTENGETDSFFYEGDTICDLSDTVKAVLAEVMAEKRFSKPEALKCPDYCDYANICRERSVGK